MALPEIPLFRNKGGPPVPGKNGSSGPVPRGMVKPGMLGGPGPGPGPKPIVGNTSTSGLVPGGSSGPVPGGSSGPVPGGSSGPVPGRSSGPVPGGSSGPVPAGLSRSKP